MSGPATDPAREALDAVPGIPKDDDGPVFREPWEAQAFAMTLGLYQKGLFTWNEWAEALGADYVYSLKPNPALLAEHGWRPDHVRSEIREALEETRGCCVEVILLAISTVRHEPQRLWEWAQIASEETARLA